MNKKLLFGMFAAAVMLFATSCQKEDLTLGEETVVSFTLEQAGIETRAYSDGTNATTLTYAVYEANSTEPLITSDNEVPFSGKKATVSLNLVTGKSYDIIFWADAPVAEGEIAPYTFDADAQTITVDYTDATSQDENRDAFFAAVKGLVVDGPASKVVELRRPFAQLNIGATDTTEAADAGFIPKQSSVTVSNVYNTLNLLDGTVSEPVKMTFGLADIPGKETFPVNGVKYLSMNYLLVAGKETVDIAFTATEENGSNKIQRTYTNVPVQRNYRTNIYGKILTSTVEIIVETESEFAEPDYDQKQTERELVEEGVWKEKETDDYIITNTTGFVSVLTRICQDGGDFYLESDIDMTGVEFSPIITGDNAEGPKILIDGQGHKIVGLKYNGDVTNAGLLQKAGTNTVIRNLIIENAEMTTTGTFAGGIVGYNYGKIINCHIVGGSFTAANSAGAITGIQNTGGKIIGCTVKNAEVIANGFAAGSIIGNNAGGGHVVACRAENVAVGGTATNIGGITGINNAGYSGASRLIASYSVGCKNLNTNVAFDGASNICNAVGNYVGRYYAETTSCYFKSNDSYTKVYSSLNNLILGELCELTSAVSDMNSAIATWNALNNNLCEYTWDADGALLKK